ncbi:hepatoma-derived growth factor-related protein 2 [Rhodamnia argentea]|uniref:Hepatoma-derived growth factor-related protein 2 n=1 Tax=Rhodamnia argentea TaxID=178133 RepID=A0A8B8NTL7_9MYRT|nr:hepatoma-derived growth factor-related protein 2 [Rhodamnia argentea]
MLDGILKSKFHNKCKTAIKLTKTRLETIMKKRNSVERYLRKDIADLLGNGLDTNAYGRAEGLLIEQNMTSCYNLVKQFCECISDQITAMQKQSECPEECREAIASLMYAAARFADLPELRELRSLFADRYGKSLEPFVNKEFVEKMRSQQRTKDMKLQLMRDLALEFSVDWDSKALEQKLFNATPHQEESKVRSSGNTADNDYHKQHKSEDHADSKRESDYAEDKPQKDMLDPFASKRNGRDLPFYGRKGVTDDTDKLSSSSSSEAEVISPPKKEFPRGDKPNYSSSSSGSPSEDDTSRNKPLSYRDIPPPYVKAKIERNRGITDETPTNTASELVDKNCEARNPVGVAKPKPRSVRQRPLPPPPGRESELTRATEIDDEEERRLDGLLMHYSKKQSPYDLSEPRGSIKPPPKLRTYQENGEPVQHKSTKSDVFAAPARGASLPLEPTTPAEATESAKGHCRSTSLQPDMLAGHVHPNLPDYDDLAARIAALRGR